MLLPIVKAHAIDIVDEGLRRDAFGKDEAVIGKLDMKIGENLRHVLLPGDRGPIHQGPGLNQNPAYEEGVIRRDEEVALGLIDAKGAFADADRKNAQGVGEAGRTVCRPIHRTGRSSPSELVTRSPI